MQSKRLLLIVIFVFIAWCSNAWGQQKNTANWQYLTERMQYGIYHASQYYQINPSVLYTIAYIESNFNFYAVNKNKNGSKDYGVFQINSENLKKLGYSTDIAFDPYWAAYIAAYILKNCFIQYGNTWHTIDCYNKGKNAKHSSKYIWRFYMAWNKFYPQAKSKMAHSHSR